MAAPASRQAPAAAEYVDPVYEWLDDGDSYLLRLKLPEFKKEDLRVHVDDEGRLTVIGQRRPAPGAGGEQAKATRLHKAFQLPNTANLGAISGRFDGTVLTLTVPKLQQEQPPAATPLPPPSTTQAKEEEAQQVADGGKPQADQEDMAGRASLAATGKEEDDKAKAKAERERQCEHWKERAVEEGLKLADAVSKNKEVIAAAVAGIALGVFVSHKLFSRS
ncbi:hypothetical protein PVAP13_5KG401007 [Panicum virgatum]|uniref:SHSP domain-containing protein n=1 Tax=Panicum virgatum TaxID=38727 RepID=A0A8T0SKN8_PANVG|nr:hypothetical protein PVAP13_5KG401007 [Panicum virgatum]